MTDERRARPVVAPTILTAVHGLLWIGVLVMLLRVVPGYCTILEDFDAEVPVATIWVIQLSVFSLQYWYLLILLIGVFCIVDFLALYFLRGSAGRTVLRYVWVITMLVTPLCLLVWFLLAVQLPMLQMTESLS